MHYTVIVEKGQTSFGAYVPDLPGCVAVGETKEEALSHPGIDRSAYRKS
jgi:predicted RNase H-like HicB family nuclease